MMKGRKMQKLITRIYKVYEGQSRVKGPIPVASIGWLIHIMVVPQVVAGRNFLAQFFAPFATPTSKFSASQGLLTGSFSVRRSISSLSVPRLLTGGDRFPNLTGSPLDHGRRPFSNSVGVHWKPTPHPNCGRRGCWLMLLDSGLGELAWWVLYFAAEPRTPEPTGSCGCFRRFFRWGKI